MTTPISTAKMLSVRFDGRRRLGAAGSGGVAFISSRNISWPTACGQSVGGAGGVRRIAGKCGLTSSEATLGRRRIRVRVPHPAHRIGGNHRSKARGVARHASRVPAQWMDADGGAASGAMRVRLRMRSGAALSLRYWRRTVRACRAARFSARRCRPTSRRAPPSTASDAGLAGTAADRRTNRDNANPSRRRTAAPRARGLADARRSTSASMSRSR